MSGCTKHLECIRLASVPVQRKHQLASQALAEGVIAHERLELGDDLTLTTERKIRVDPVLERREPKLLESRDFGLRKIRVCKLGERGPTPETERLGECCGCGRVVAVRKQLAPALDESLEPRCVELVHVEDCGVAVDACLDHGLADCFPQLRDVDLDILWCGRRRSAVPESLDEPFVRDGLATVENEQGEQRGLLAAAHRQAIASIPDLERAEQADVHRARANVSTIRIRLPGVSTASLPAERGESAAYQPRRAIVRVVFETYRMLGAQREAELLAEAERLHRGRRLRGKETRARTLLRPLTHLVSVLAAVAFGSSTR